MKVYGKPTSQIKLDFNSFTYLTLKIYLMMREDMGNIHEIYYLKK